MQDRTERLFREMIRFYGGDPARIQHFIKVHSFAMRIAAGENLPAAARETLEPATIVHDIGIKPSEELYGDSAGEHQEQLGPPLARRMLTDLGYDKAVVERVCTLVGRHHTYKGIDGLDCQILIEADFLVNLFENSTGQPAARAAMDSIFRTETGRALCADMFALDPVQAKDNAAEPLGPA